MKNIYNILPHKALSPLPREGGFNFGDCPGAAAITIILSFFSSLRGTLGFAGAESREQRAESMGQRAWGEELRAESRVQRAWGEEQGEKSEERRAESRAQTGPAVPIAIGSNCGLHFVWTAGAANAGKENKKYRISLPGLLTGKDECRMMNDEPERNITVRCTSGFHAFSSATNIVGATHLGFQTADTAISGIAAVPRNICRTAGHPSGKKVQSTETLKENKKYRIFNIQYSTKNQNPLAETPSDRVIRAGRNFEPSGKKYKTLSRLPQEGGFYSGDSSGAAAITNLQFLFSSPRVSPTGNQDAEFSTPHSSQCGVPNSTSRSACKGLPVKNRPETGVFPWYSHPESASWRRGTSSHLERQLLRTNQKGGTPMS